MLAIDTIGLDSLACLAPYTDSVTILRMYNVTPLVVRLNHVLCCTHEFMR